RAGEPVDPTAWLAQGNPQAKSAVNAKIQHDPAKAPRPASLGLSAGAAPGQGTPMPNQPGANAPATDPTLDAEVQARLAELGRTRASRRPRTPTSPPRRT